MVYESKIKIKLNHHNRFYVLDKPEILYAGDFDAIAASCLKPAKYDEVMATANVIANKITEVKLNEEEEITMMNSDILVHPFNKIENNDIDYVTTEHIKLSAMDLLHKTISTTYGVSIKTSVILREFKVEDGKVASLRVNEYSRVHLYLRKPGYVRKCEPQSVLEGLHVRFLGGDDNTIPVEMYANEYVENLGKLREETRRVIRLIKAADIDSDYESEVTNALSDLEMAIMRLVESTVARMTNENWKLMGGGQKK